MNHHGPQETNETRGNRQETLGDYPPGNRLLCRCFAAFAAAGFAVESSVSRDRA